MHTFVLFPSPASAAPALPSSRQRHACGRGIHTPSHTTQHVYAKGVNREICQCFSFTFWAMRPPLQPPLLLFRVVAFLASSLCAMLYRFRGTCPRPAPSAGAWAGHSPRTPEAGGRRRRGEWERRQESLVVHDGMRPCPGARGPPQRQRPQRVAHSCWLEWHFWVSWEQNCSQTATGACGQGQTETYTQQRPRHNGADPAKQTPKLSPRQVCVCVCADVQHWRTGAASWRSMSV